MSSSSSCGAGQRLCGTPGGWRAGCRQWRCRTAHNAESTAYRGLDDSQRMAVLALLRAGRTLEQAAEGAGLPPAAVSSAAAHDRELRGALDGLPVPVQQAARYGYYLGALIRTGGDGALAARVSALSGSALAERRGEDPGFAEAERAVLRWIAGLPGADAEAPSGASAAAAQALEQGADPASAARRGGLTLAGMRAHASRHPRLAHALWVAEEAVVGACWGDPDTSVREIAESLGVSPRTVHGIAGRMQLPPRPAAVQPGARSAVAGAGTGGQ